VRENLPFQAIKKVQNLCHKIIEKSSFHKDTDWSKFWKKK